jgi:hypothetical protein
VNVDFDGICIGNAALERLNFTGWHIIAGKTRFENIDIYRKYWNIATA